MIGTEYGSLPFKQQIAFFRQKTNLPTERWADIWKQAHDRAFMVAGAMQEDLLADFRGAVDKAISEGKSLGWFKAQFNDIVARHGWTHKGSAEWRANVIYETNIRQSYTAGREQQIDAVKSTRPYGLYRHSGAEHPRFDHLSWNNLVLPLDDPWWKTHTPINGYGCACKKLTLSERDLKRMGLEVSKAPTIETYEWIDTVTGEVHDVPKGIDPGFDYTPRSSAELTEHVKKVIAKKPPLEARLPARLVESAFSTVAGVNAQSLSTLLAAFDGDELAAFKAVMQKHQLKTVVLKAGEMSVNKKAAALAPTITEYLGLENTNRWPFVTRRVSRTRGFTSSTWSHVVVKAKATHNLKKVDAQPLRDAIANAVNGGGDRPWSFSTVASEQVSEPAQVFVTWVHEMGHQVHHKAGAPMRWPEARTQSLTGYGSTNENEWFAEHFVAWLLTPDALRSAQPAVFDFISDTVAKAQG
ncbi:phage minor head protein [Grimontia hollisae]|uniref:phage minor head protein n=1 Tax=Grimontia hollisae TaxID=673 RepID=UPI000DF900EC|nr:phage minor head protein [Grimontia hollisae]STQ75529.1 Phage Mu protein F like protein [Grimontia hollisae]